MTTIVAGDGRHASASVSRWQLYPGESPHTAGGDVRWIRHMVMPQLHARRAVTLWLPPGYEQESRRYPVLYMFDGQNLFDEARAYGGVEWRVDESMATLAAAGLPAIVVGVDHGGERRVREYTPYGTGLGDRTLDFLEELLVPRMDAEFRTDAQAGGRFLVGSSMGGLMSLHGLATRPHLFGGAAALSPALWPAGRAIFRTVRALPAAIGRLYIDNGTAEPSAAPFVRLLREKGYADGESLRYVVEEGGTHSERAWAGRFPDAARFLLQVPDGKPETD
jgi:predicted alpha/beta superfamily hydrolase